MKGKEKGTFTSDKIFFGTYLYIYTDKNLQCSNEYSDHILWK